jgi:hypothetical protein
MSILIVHFASMHDTDTINSIESGRPPNPTRGDAGQKGERQ